MLILISRQKVRSWKFSERLERLNGPDSAIAKIDYFWAITAIVTIVTIKWTPGFNKLTSTKLLKRIKTIIRKFYWVPEPKKPSMEPRRDYETKTGAMLINFNVLFLTKKLAGRCITI